MTNPTTHDSTKPSTVETIKEKAANFVNKVSGKTTDHHHDATHDHTHDHTQHDHTHDQTHHNTVQPDHTHDKINTSAFLSSTRFPDEADTSAHASYPVTQPESSYVPAHVQHVAPGTGLAGALHDEHHNPLHKDHHHHNQASGDHKVDDPQHEITSRLVGAPKDPNNLESAHIKPVM